MHGDVMDRVNTFLEQSGIKGMKWGVRRREGPDGTVSNGPDAKAGDSAATKTDAQKAREIHAKARKNGINSLSNQEMQTLVNRMQLEANYSKITQQQSKLARGREFVNRQLKTGKTVNDVIAFANSPAGNLMASFIRGPSGKYALGRKAGRRIKV